MPKIKKIRTDVISPQEMGQLIAKAPSPAVRCMVSMLYNYGLRVSEMLELKPTDLGIKNYCLYIRTLTLKSRAKVLPEKRTLKRNINAPFVSYIIAYHTAMLNTNNKWLYPSPQNMDNHITRKTVLNILARLDPTIWCHLFRHTRATIFGEDNASSYQLMAWFGWKDPRPAERYIRKSEKLIEALANTER